MEIAFIDLLPSTLPFYPQLLTNSALKYPKLSNIRTLYCFSLGVLIWKLPDVSSISTRQLSFPDSQSIHSREWIFLEDHILIFSSILFTFQSLNPAGSLSQPNSQSHKTGQNFHYHTIYNKSIISLSFKWQSIIFFNQGFPNGCTPPPRGGGKTGNSVREAGCSLPWRSSLSQRR